MSDFNEDLFQDVFIPDLGSEIAVMSGNEALIDSSHAIVPDAIQGDGQPKVMDLLAYILDDENVNESIFESSKDPTLEESSIHSTEDPKKFQLRIKATKRKYTKHKKEDTEHKEINTRKESADNKLKRPRGRPRIYKNPEDRPKYYYTKKEKVSMRNSSSSMAYIYGDGSVRINGRTKDKLRRDELKTTLSKMKMIVPGLTDKTDKATVIENASQYALFLKKQVGDSHDRDFLRLIRAEC